MIVNLRKNLRIIILLSSITLITANKAYPPPRSVNVALETSFLFDPKDLHQNKHFVNNIREFLDKLLLVIDPQEQRSRFRSQSKRRDNKLEGTTDYTEKLKNLTEIGTSINNVFDFVKNFSQNFVNLTGNKIAEAVSNMHVEVITETQNSKLTEATESKYLGSTAIPEKVKDPQKQHSRYRAHDKRRHTKDKLEEITDSIEKLENKPGTGMSIKHVFNFVKNVGRRFLNLTGNKIAEAVNNMHVEVINEPTKSKDKGSTTIPKQAKRAKHDKKDYKTIITESINNWMRRYPKEIKTIMNNTVNGTNPLLNTFARRMHNYYNDDDKKKLKKLLKKFKRNIENNQDNSPIVNDLLNNAIFKKYGNLNDSTKLALMEDLKMCTEILFANDVFRDFNKNLSVFTRRSLSNPKIETDEISNIDDITNTNLRRSIDNKLTETREKNEDNQKKKTNEIVLDGEEFLASPARKP